MKKIVNGTNRRFRFNQACEIGQYYCNGTADI